MKKIIAITLCILFLFVLCSCDDKNNQDIPSSNMNDIENSDAVSEQSNTTNTSSINNTNSTNTDTKCTHLWGQWVEKTKATCQTSGLKERSCRNCNIAESEEIKSLKHEESDWIIDKVATETEEGKKHTECINCSKKIKEETIPTVPKGHTHTAKLTIISKIADCTNSGTKSTLCSCGQTIGTETIPALGHTVVIDKAIAVTCTSNGLTEGKHCSTCDIILTEQTVVKSTGHNMTSKKMTENEQEYTLHYCTKCDYSYEEGKPVTDKLKYKSNGDGTCVITGLKDTNVKHLMLPTKSPDGDTVVSIDHEAFKSNKTIETLVIPDTVTSIGYSAFQGCSNLKSITFPQSNKTPIRFNYQSFGFIGVVDIDLSKTLIEEISNNAFCGCKSLKTVKLGDVSKINNFAFQECVVLESVIHNGKLISIGERAFENTKRLSVLRSKDSKHNLDTIETFSYHTFYGSAIRDIVFSENLKATNSAFEGCLNLGTVDFSKHTNKFSSFSGSKIEKIIFPSAITSIGSSVFYNATIDSIVIPDTVTEIGSRAFANANIKKITFGSDLKTIKDEAFINLSATYDFSKVKEDLTIGSKAFANNTFTTLILPKTTVSIGQAALSGCDKLQTLSIPFIAKNAESTNVSSDCFAWLFGSGIDCWDQDSVVPKSLKTVILNGENPSTRDFMTVKITDFVIGKNITEIGSENFDDDSTLKRLYYEGTEQEFATVKLNTSTNSKLVTATKYFYSASKPTTSGNYWHYDSNGNVVIW